MQLPTITYDYLQLAPISGALGPRLFQTYAWLFQTYAWLFQTYAWLFQTDEEVPQTLGARYGHFNFSLKEIKEKHGRNSHQQSHRRCDQSF